MCGALVTHVQRPASFARALGGGEVEGNDWASQFASQPVGDTRGQ